MNGKGMLSFGSGQPDLPPPPEIYGRAGACSDLRYGQVQGMEDLRRALCRQQRGSGKDDFVITNGASEALDMALRVIAAKGPGGKVLLPRPYYYSYPPLVRYAGMEPVYTDLVDGRIDLDDFGEKVRGCRAVIINSPSNPTGRVESVSTLKAIERLATDLGVYVLSDEVYKDLIYTRGNYMLRGPHVITINSFSKTYSMCGVRVGYMWSPDREFIGDCTEMKTHTSMNTSIVGQAMAFEATRTPRSFIRKQLSVWKERRDVIYEGLTALGLDLWKPEGAFYVLPRVERPRDFVLGMFRRHKVITYLGEWFGAPKRVRFSYALDVGKIEEGLRRVEKYLGSRKAVSD